MWVGVAASLDMVFTFLGHRIENWYEKQGVKIDGKRYGDLQRQNTEK